MKPKIIVVIGKNFGDEGKGRVVDDLSRQALCGDDGFSSECGRCLVIRHNGGAQSGHTVVHHGTGNEPGREVSGAQSFVFHELGAGSFNGADTLWADTFYPDLYKLNEEYTAFEALSGRKSSIFSMPETPITTIDDVLLNMALEKSRGEGRHGSCGMGIYEAFLRTRAGFGITVKDVKDGGEKELYARLKRNRDEYVLPRFRELANGQASSLQGDTCNEEYSLDLDKCGEIAELLKEDNVLRNAAIEMCDAAKKVTLVGAEEKACKIASTYADCDDTQTFLEEYDSVIFETGQGLLLDSENAEYAPHVTGSRTGLTNPASLTEKLGLTIDEVVYVTRTYVTRHGAGPLKHECERAVLGITNPDSTNVTNEWQGDFRYAPHDSITDFVSAVIDDLGQISYSSEVSLAITHTGDTDGCMLFSGDGGALNKITIEEFKKNEGISRIFDGYYVYD